MGKPADYFALTFYLHAAQFLWCGVIMIYAWNTRKHDETKGQIKELEKRVATDVDNLENVLIKVERDLKHAPSDDHIKDLHERINGVAQGLTKVEGKLGQMEKTLGLVHQHLLSHSGNHP